VQLEAVAVRLSRYSEKSEFPEAIFETKSLAVQYEKAKVRKFIAKLIHNSMNDEPNK
jgi:hypothetical protein